MRSKKIYHRKIKPENVLLGLHREIKLADFGYAVHPEFRPTVCGTLDYLSPEIALIMFKPGRTEEYYAKAIGQWSLGILCCELFVGRPTFETKSMAATQKKIAGFTGKWIMFSGHVSKEAEGLVRVMLDLDADKGMKVEEVLVHKWIVMHVVESEKLDCAA
jgi:serine/threonine protein kinase